MRRKSETYDCPISVPQALRKLMKRAKIHSQGELSRQSGFHTRMISAWMNEKETPNLRSLGRLAEVGGVRLSKLIEYGEG